MATKKAGSTSYSASSHSTGRYAHPFFTTTPHAVRKPINGNTRMTDWSKQQLGPVPAVLRGDHMDLAEVIGAAGGTENEGVREIRLHALGDNGVGRAYEAAQISAEIATGFKH